MQETGVRNGAFGVDKFGLKKLGSVYWNLGTSPLYEHALRANEAVLTAEGALCAETGVFTGRSPTTRAQDEGKSWSVAMSAGRVLLAHEYAPPPPDRTAPG